MAFGAGRLEFEMIKIGVTGATGLLGWHLRCFLRTQPEIDVVTIGREEFADLSKLRTVLQGCDAIVHFAGKNRGDAQEIEGTNYTLARKLVEGLGHSRSNTHLVFSSSTHVDRDTAYGRSKRKAAEVLGEWARGNARFSNVVLPHVFGEMGRPFHNSVVSTFCYQLAHGETPQIDRDSELELLHAQDVAAICLDAIRAGQEGEMRPAGHLIRVSDLLKTVSSMHGLYRRGIIPSLSSLFELRLFNTLRSYLFPHFYPQLLPLHEDERGSLFEAVKTEHGGQAFLSTTRPGVTRGEHFHFRKIERFLVVDGQAVIRLRRLLDHRVLEFNVSGEEPMFIDMPTLHTHNITNVGDGDLLTFFWSHEVFDSESPDTYPEPVVLEAGA